MTEEQAELEHQTALGEAVAAEENYQASSRGSYVDLGVRKVAQQAAEAAKQKQNEALDTLMRIRAKNLLEAQIKPTNPAI